MRENKQWVAMMILGGCFILIGLAQIINKNYGFAIFQFVLGMIEIVIALIEKKCEKRDKKEN